MEGVYNVTIEEDIGKVTVLGILGPEVLIKRLIKSGKHAELWDTPQKGSNQPKSTMGMTVAQSGNEKGGKDGKGDQKQEMDKTQQPKGGAEAQLSLHNQAPQTQQQQLLLQQSTCGAQALMQKQHQLQEQQLRQQQQSKQKQQQQQLFQQQLLKLNAMPPSSKDQQSTPNEEDANDEGLDEEFDDEDDDEDEELADDIEEVYQPPNRTGHQVPSGMLMIGNGNGGIKEEESSKYQNGGGSAKKGDKAGSLDAQTRGGNIKPPFIGIGVGGETSITANGGSQKGEEKMAGQMRSMGGQMANILRSQFQSVLVLPSEPLHGALPGYFQGAGPGYIHGAGPGYPQRAVLGGNLHEQQRQQYGKVWGSQKGEEKMASQMGSMGGRMANMHRSHFQSVHALPSGPIPGALPGYFQGVGPGYPQKVPDGNLHEQQQQQEYMAAMAYARPPQANYYPASPGPAADAFTHHFNDEDTSSCIIM